MKVLRKWYLPGIVALIALVLLLQAAPALANENHNPQILPPKSHPYGKTYGEWNAMWWQWFFSVKASKNPGLATDGKVDCQIGQSGNVWFLAGSFLNGGSFTRNCTVPKGKALFIPLINSWADNVCNSPPLTVDQLRTNAANGVYPPSNLHASVDGHAFTDLRSYRSRSPVFSYTLPPSPDNVIDAAFGVSLPGPCWPSLTVAPAVADGYYIMLAPLCEGVHTINFGGSGPGITLDMTYKLKVVD
ncbi:MAG: hypothetical protein ACXWPG_14540 [Ktedonobacteraceae bacterium]